MLAKTGIPTASNIESVFPNQERLNKGAIAIIECFQRIPCDPCSKICKRGAILPFDDINDLPIINAENCNGCGLCIAKCPGSAIMVVNVTWSDDKAMIKLPYEFYPLPEVGQFVGALDREGKVVAQAEVVSVLNTEVLDKTPIVSIAVDKSMVKIVRNLTTRKPSVEIVCRCSDLSLDEIHDLIEKGYTSVDEIKRIARLGMGPCQGRNCGPLVLKILAGKLGKEMKELSPGTFRPMIKSVKLGDLADYEDIIDGEGCCHE
jgi:Fe-S-cluster-containing hydrogenase component 2